MDSATGSGIQNRGRAGGCRPAKCQQALRGSLRPPRHRPDPPPVRGPGHHRAVRRRQADPGSHDQPAGANRLRNHPLRRQATGHRGPRAGEAPRRRGHGVSVVQSVRAQDDLAKKLGATKINFVAMLSANREAFLRQGKVNMVVATYSVTPKGSRLSACRPLLHRPPGHPRPREWQQHQEAGRPQGQEGLLRSGLHVDPARLLRRIEPPAGRAPARCRARHDQDQDPGRADPDA